ncbi:hypothetical protein BC940DRAFT_314930 [Gongronella butleri]|nr:hypothetical protein BC940DRAFT_314930 [Gongronella butleri]
MVTGMCGDGMTVQHTYKSQNVQFDADAAQQMGVALAGLTREAHTHLFGQLYECRMLKLEIQAAIDTILWNLHLRSDLVAATDLWLVLANSEDDHDQGGDAGMRAAWTDDVLSVKRVLNTLFSMNMDASHGYFGQHVREWVLHVGGVLLRLGQTTADRLYLLHHLRQCTDVAQWGAPLIQHLHDDDNNNDPSAMNLATRALALVFQSKEDDNGKDPWQEDDFVACLDQLDLVNVFSRWVAAHDDVEKAMDNDQEKEDKHAQFFIICGAFFDAMLSGVEMASQWRFSGLTKRLTQQLCHVVRVFLQSRQAHATMASRTHALVLDTVAALMAVMDHDVWSQLNALPFDSMPVPLLWDVSLRFLCLDASFRPPTRWQHLLRQPPALDSLADMVQSHANEAVFLVGCLTSITVAIASGADTPSVVDTTVECALVTLIAHALFQLAFVFQATAAYKDVRDALGIMAEAHPFVISLLLRWTHAHAANMDAMALYLFRSLPLHRWHVLRDDLVFLYQFLGDHPAPWPAFAQYVIDHLPFGVLPSLASTRDDTHHASSSPYTWATLIRPPFLSPLIHEDLAFILLDTCMLYRSQLLQSDATAAAAASASASTSASASASDVLSQPMWSSLQEEAKLSSSSSSSGVPMAKVGSNSSSGSVSSASIGNNGNNKEGYAEFVAWAWTIIQQLALYHRPVSSRAMDVDKCIDAAFVREYVNHPNDAVASHAAMLVFVVLSLSPTSRQFLRFDAGFGWRKLLLILTRGPGTAFIQLLSQCVPPFVYLHGDDFFLSDTAMVDLVRHVIHLKKDPMLRAAAAAELLGSSIGTTKGAKNEKSAKSVTNLAFFPQKHQNGMALIFGAHAWHARYIDRVSHLDGFSYLHLVMNAWLTTLMRRDDWMWQEEYIELMDNLCFLAFVLGLDMAVVDLFARETTRLHALSSSSSSTSPINDPHHPSQQQQQQQQQQPAMTKSMSMSSSSSSGSLAAAAAAAAASSATMTTTTAATPRNVLRYIRGMLPETTSILSLLNGEWSMLSLTANNLYKTPGVESSRLWFAFYVLLVETRIEAPLRRQLAEHLLSRDNVADAHDSFLRLTNKPIDFFVIYRLAQHILAAPMDHPALPLLLQLFFCLYFETACRASTTDNKQCPRVALGAAFFVKRQQEMVAKVRDRVASLQTYQSQRASASASSPSTLPEQQQQENYDYHERLREMYHAMWLWLGMPSPANKHVDMDALESHYCPARLAACLVPSRVPDNEDTDNWERQQPWFSLDTLWTNLVQREALLARFDAYPWIDRDKLQ